MSKEHVVGLVVALAVLGGIVGLLVSQYFPIFGGVITVGRIAPPWTPHLRTVIGPHVFAFAATGASIGVLVGWLKQR